MNGADAAGCEALLAAADILEQVETAIVVADTHGNLRFANSFAVELFGFPGAADQLAGRPLHSLGFEEGDARRTGELTQQVLRGKVWEGTFVSRRADRSRVFVRAQAVPIRQPSGTITGV